MNIAKKIVFWVFVLVGMFLCVIGGLLILRSTQNNSGVGVYTHELIITAGIEDVYKYIADPENYDSWMKDVEEITLLTDSTQPTYLIQTRNNEYEIRILTRQQNRAVEYEKVQTTKNIRERRLFTLQNENNNTRIKLKTTIYYGTKDQAFWAPINNYFLEGEMQRELQRLKKNLES